MKNTSKTTSTMTQSMFPVSFTLEQLQDDILEIYLLQLRTMHFFASEKKVWELAGKNDIGELLMGEIQAKTYGLTYMDIQDSRFAKAMEQQYSFGFFGIDNQICDILAADFTHTWVAAYLNDLKTSNFISEWEQNYALINVGRCLHTCELANARNVLEGKENFYSFTSIDDFNKAEGGLTIHQMALLSGMEEMTIRTAISRPSANQLTSFKDDRRTLIKIKDAKAWLIAKGRYVPVSQTQAVAVLDLKKTSFKSINDFLLAISRRVVYLNESYPDSNLTQKFMAVASNSDNSDERSTRIKNQEDLLNSELMTKWANILEVPAKLMILRAREAVLQDDLARVNTELDAAYSNRKN